MDEKIVACSIPLAVYLASYEVSLTRQLQTYPAKLIAQRLSMLSAVVVLFYPLSLYLYGTQTEMNHATVPGAMHLPTTRKPACMP